MLFAWFLQALSSLVHYFQAALRGKWCLTVLLQEEWRGRNVRVKKNTHLKCLNEDTKDLIFLCLQQRALHKFKAYIKFKVRFPLAAAAAELLHKRLLLLHDSASSLSSPILCIGSSIKKRKRLSETLLIPVSSHLQREWIKLTISNQRLSLSEQILR